MEIIKQAIDKSSGTLKVLFQMRVTSRFVNANGVQNTYQLCVDLINEQKVAFLQDKVLSFPSYLRVEFAGSKDNVDLFLAVLLKYLKT